MSNTPSLFLFLSLLALPAVAADTAKGAFDCDDPLQSAPLAIKKTLGDLYRIEPSKAQLDAASADLKQLLSAASFCRIRSQSPSAHADAQAKQALTREWLSLHMWINRIADFVYLNAKGRNTVNWKDEYTEFASLYEFEA